MAGGEGSSSRGGDSRDARSQPQPPPPKKPKLTNEEAQERVQQEEIRQVVDRLISQIVNDEDRKQRRNQMEREKVERTRRKEEEKNQKDIERHVRNCLESIIKKIEKDHALVHEEDGLPYSEAKRHTHVFKMSGLPCADFFECAIPRGVKDTSVEAAVRDARNEYLQYDRLKKRVSTGTSASDKSLPLPKLEWVSPTASNSDRPWTIICLKLKY